MGRAGLLQNRLVLLGSAAVAAVLVLTLSVKTFLRKPVPRASVGQTNGVSKTGGSASPSPIAGQGPSQGFIACVAGGNRKFGNSEASFMGAAVRRLRDLGNDDPLTVYHVNAELRGEEVEMLKGLTGVSVKDIIDIIDLDDKAAVKNDIRRYRGFDCKVVALLHSPYQKTMLIDSDTMFFTNPARLWNNPIVVQTGTMFFYDRKTNDRANPSPAGNVKCDNIVGWAHAEEVKKHLGTSLLDNFRQRHQSFCDGATKHEVCSSLVVIDGTHPTGNATLSMLKKLHTGYIMVDGHVGSWSWGDKEYYWIACELTGNVCGFSPRGRPMHVYNYDEQLGKERKKGCSVQVAPDGEGWDLLHGNLDYVCPLMNRMLNAITVWNPRNPEPLVDGDTQSMTTGRGTRMLSEVELMAIFKYWKDIEELQGTLVAAGHR